MFLLTRAEELDIERDTISAVLDSVLRTRGGGETLAKKAGVTAVHLSYIRRQQRMPRLRTARKIAQALSLSAEQRGAWLHHVERFWQLKNATRQEVRHLLRDISPSGGCGSSSASPF